MSDFNDHWLALRASADSRARADVLLRRLPLAPGTCLRVIDLGCGTGANLRHLAPLLAAAGASDQHWTCIDHDAELLQRLRQRTAAWATDSSWPVRLDQQAVHIDADHWHCRVQTRHVDLAASLADLDWPVGALVTASALLDLVSARWLDGLLQRCHAARCQLLFTLSYNGRCVLQPAQADDALVIDLVNRHQLTDKGFGPALGPTAAGAIQARCSRLGYQVAAADSDWRIGPDEPDLQRALIDGWRQAARQLAPTLEDRIDAWYGARIALIARAESRIEVGHRDMVAALGPAADPGCG